jgi:hypothetical protein
MLIALLGWIASFCIGGKDRELRRGRKPYKV